VQAAIAPAHLTACHLFCSTSRRYLLVRGIARLEAPIRTWPGESSEHCAIFSLCVPSMIRAHASRRRQKITSYMHLLACFLAVYYILACICVIMARSLGTNKNFAPSLEDSVLRKAGTHAFEQTRRCLSGVCMYVYIYIIYAPVFHMHP
jgi:hypothetical protein